MNFKSMPAWTVLLCLAAALAMPPLVANASVASEDRNFDGQADVWQLYDDEGELIGIIRDRNFDGYVDAREVLARRVVVSRTVDQNFDHRFDPGLTGVAATQSDVTFNVAPQPFLLPRAVYVGDHLIEDRALFAPERSSQFRFVSAVSGRAPPADR